MALRNQPYIPIYVNDVLSDERLIECSAESHGVYFRLLCMMHKSEHYGMLLLKQKDKQKSSMSLNFATYLVRLLPFDLATISRSLQELLDNKILHIEGDYLIQKRMVKDYQISMVRASAGKKGGGKTGKKIKGISNQFANDFALTKTQSNSENEYEIENDIESDNNKKKGDKGKEKKNLFGQFLNVMLTDSEVEKLKSDFGDALALDAIEYLSSYGKEKSGNFKKYKDHNLTIRRWVIDAVKEQNQKQSGKKSIVESRNNKLNEFVSKL